MARASTSKGERTAGLLGLSGRRDALLAVLLHRRLVTEIDALGDHARLIVLPPPCPLDVSPNNFGRAGELIERSLIAARDHLDALDDGGGTPMAPGHRRRPHVHARR